MVESLIQNLSGIFLKHFKIFFKTKLVFLPYVSNREMQAYYKVQDAFEQSTLGRQQTPVQTPQPPSPMRHAPQQRPMQTFQSTFRQRPPNTFQQRFNTQNQMQRPAFHAPINLQHAVPANQAPYYFRPQVTGPPQHAYPGPTEEDIISAGMRYYANQTGSQDF